MARGKRKKKKSSQTNCEISSQETDSHGTTTNHGQNPAATECTCLSKSQKVRSFLLCCVATETPYCPIHTSEGRNVIKKTKQRKAEKGTSKQPSRIRRIGRWLIKKVTKGKKEEPIPNEPMESISATVCINPDKLPRHQVLCQQVLSVDGLEDTTQANDISVDSESVSLTLNNILLKLKNEIGQTTLPVSVRSLKCVKVTVVAVDVDVHREFSLNELCRAVVTIDDDKKTSVTDSKEDLAYDEEQNPKNYTEPDTYDINPEYEQHTVMTLKEMCKAAVTHYDAIKLGQTYDKEQDEAIEFELDNEGITPECDKSSLTELCTKAISNADDRKPTEVENNDKANDDEPDTKDKIPECDTNNVMSLKEMCTTTVETADGMTTTINDIENDRANDVKEAYKPPECEQAMTFSLKELCSTAIRNADDLNRDTKYPTEERIHNKELEEANENKTNITENNLECDKYPAKAFKELYPAATRNVNDMETSVDDTELNQTSDKDPNESEPSSYGVNHKSDNASVQSLKELCLKAIEYADDVKPDVSGTLEDQTGDKELNEVDDNTEENTIMNLDCIRNQAWPMTEDCTIAIENAPNMRISIYDTDQEQAYCKDQEDSNESEPSDIDANKNRNPTAEIGVGARPKKRNLANENMIQAALKKTHDEAVIQSDCVTGSKAATNITASEATRHVGRRQRAEAKPYTGGEHGPNPNPEPKLLSKSHTEQKKDTTPCIETGSSNTEISHGTHRKKKRKRRKAKWY